MWSLLREQHVGPNENRESAGGSRWRPRVFFWTRGKQLVDVRLVHPRWRTFTGLHNSLSKCRCPTSGPPTHRVRC